MRLSRHAAHLAWCTCHRVHARHGARLRLSGSIRVLLLVLDKQGLERIWLAGGGRLLLLLLPVLEPAKTWLEALCSRLCLCWGAEVETCKKIAGGLSLRLLWWLLLELLRLLRGKLLRSWLLLRHRLLLRNRLVLNYRLLLHWLCLLKSSAPVVAPTIICSLSSDGLLLNWGTHIEEVLNGSSGDGLCLCFHSLLLLLNRWLLLRCGSDRSCARCGARRGTKAAFTLFRLRFIHRCRTFIRIVIVVLLLGSSGLCGSSLHLLIA